jgi:hypothetical protein
MDADAAAMAAQVVPYATAALSAYGGAVLARVQDDAADATVGLGRRLLHKIFGTHSAEEPLPEPLADLAADPGDSDAVAALRLYLRKLLTADTSLRADLGDLLAGAGVTVTAVGERSIAAHTISGIASTGDNATIHQS